MGVGRHDSFEGADCKLECTVREISKIGKQLVVVLGYKVVPQEDSVLVLRAVAQQEVSPDLGRDPRVHSVVTEDSSVAGFGEFERHAIRVFLVV